MVCVGVCVCVCAATFSSTRCLNTLFYNYDYLFINLLFLAVVSVRGKLMSISLFPRMPS